MSSCTRPPHAPFAGGRSTRDFIEENVVEAIAEALDGYVAGEGNARALLDLDVESPPLDPAASKFVCRVRS